MKIKKNKTYIIAEIGINHEGKYNLAKKMILSAAKAGADAVKFQLFNPKTLAGPQSIKTSEHLFQALHALCTSILQLCLV